MSTLRERILFERKKAEVELHDPNSLFSRRQRATKRIADCDADLVLVDALGAAEGDSYEDAGWIAEVTDNLEARYPDETPKERTGPLVVLIPPHVPECGWFQPPAHQCTCGVDWLARNARFIPITTDDPEEGWPSHLRSDAPSQQCYLCHRTTWSTSEFGQQCLMLQPDGKRCTGIFGQVS